MAQLTKLLREEVVSIAEVEPFLPLYNDIPNERKTSSSSSKNSTTVALENMTTLIQTIIFSNPLVFLKHLVDHQSLQRCIESYLCHRYRPYERTEDATHHKQSHHSLLLSKLDKLIVAFYKRLTDVYDKELVSLKRFATASKISVYKSADKHTITDSEELLLLQSELRIVVNENVRILRLPYILELFSLMGESNKALATTIWSDLLRMRPALLTEISSSVEESFKATQDVHAGLVSLHTAGMVSKSSLSVEGSVYFAADIALSLALFFNALPNECLYEAGLFHESGNLSEEYGVLIFRTAQTIADQIVPILDEPVKSLGHANSTGNHGKKDTSNESEDFDQLSKILRTAKLASMRIYQRLLEVALAPVPLVVQEAASSSSSAAASESAISVQHVTPSSFFDIFSSSSSSSIVSSQHMVLDYLLHFPEGLVQYEQLLLPTFGDKEMVYAFLRSLADAVGVSLALPSTQPAAVSADVQNTRIKSSANRFQTNSRLPVSTELQEKIGQLKDMFPDLGAAFLEACLRFYNEQDNEVLDALLNDNLHPRLASLDRTMETFPTSSTSGSNSNISSGSVPKKPSANETVDIFAHRQDPNFVAQQIAFARQREALQAADASLLRREYNDDYDDQYDDLISKKDTAAENEYVESIYEDHTSTRKREEWHRQMAETRRFNALLREEEQEIAFWKGMAVNNHTAAAEKGEATASNGTTQKRREQQGGTQQPPKNSNKNTSTNAANNSNKNRSNVANSETNNNTKVDSNKTADDEDAEDHKSNGTHDPTASSSSNSQQKHRSKTFDRHHQKDKALRKLGAFRPT